MDKLIAKGTKCNTLGYNWIITIPEKLQKKCKIFWITIQIQAKLLKTWRIVTKHTQTRKSAVTTLPNAEYFRFIFCANMKVISEGKEQSRSATTQVPFSHRTTETNNFINRQLTVNITSGKLQRPVQKIYLKKSFLQDTTSRTILLVLP